MRFLQFCVISLLLACGWAPLACWGAKKASPAISARTVIPLNENWQCALDRDGTASREQWARVLPVNGQTLQLPLSWEHHPLHRMPEAVEWYTHLLTYPEKMTRAGAQLVIENPVGELEIYLDGTPLATFTGNGLTRRVMVHGEAGSEHRLTLRLDRRALPEPIRRNAMIGLGPIRLELLPPVRIDACAPLIRPTDNKCVVHYRLFAEAPCPATLTLQVQAADSTEIAHKVVALDLPIGATEGEHALSLNGFQGWTPEGPRVYRLRATLACADGTGDVCEAPCGGCAVTFDHGTMRVGGQPLLVKGMRLPGGIPLLSQPMSGQAPSLAGTLETELNLLRQAGFNAMMSDGAMLPHEAFDIADRLGLLVIAEIPPGDHARPEIRTAIEELGSHPCIAAWSWETTGATDDDVATLRALDPGRPLLLRAGAHSQLLLPSGRASIPFEDIDTTLSLPVPAEWGTRLRTWESSRQPLLVSGVGVSLTTTAAPDAVNSTLGTRSAEEQALAEIRAVVESMRRVGNAFGYFVRPLRGDSLTGLNTGSGIPTAAFTNAVGYNQRDLLVLRAAPGQAPNTAPRLEAAVINDSKHIGVFRLYQVITRPDGKTTINQLESVLTGKRVQDLTTPAIAADAGPGEYRLQLLLSDDTGVVASTQVMVVSIAGGSKP